MSSKVANGGVSWAGTSPAVTDVAAGRREDHFSLSAMESDIWSAVRDEAGRWLWW